MTVESSTTPMLLLGLEGQLFMIESQLRALRQMQSQAANPLEQWQQFAMRVFGHMQSLAGGAARAVDGGSWSDWITNSTRAWLRSAEALVSVQPPTAACQPLIDALESHASTLRETIHRLAATQPSRSQT